MRSYGQLIREITEEVVSELVAGRTFPVRKSMQKISRLVVSRRLRRLGQCRKEWRILALPGGLLKIIGVADERRLAERRPEKWSALRAAYRG